MPRVSGHVSIDVTVTCGACASPVIARVCPDTPRRLLVEPCGVCEIARAERAERAIREAVRSGRLALAPAQPRAEYARQQRRTKRARTAPD